MNEDNKRIAKNTMMLYFRMGISMVVSLFTTRIVLNTLGVVDYGIYGVVGGVVSMFLFLNGSLSGSTSRFMTIELGNKNDGQLNKVFNAALVNHFILAMIILLLAETVGLWFVMTQMIIPVERMTAALWVYQFSVFASVLSILNVPFSAMVIAHERMNVYAYMGIFDVVMRLLIIYLLVYIGFDKLIVYAILTFGAGLISLLIYNVYCQKSFPSCAIRLHKDKPLYRSLLNYSGWDLLGCFSTVAQGQGLNMLLNLFFGPAVNAARGIAVAVQGTVTQFTGNVFMAVRPQIIKKYIQGDKEALMTLVYRSSKFSFFLLWILSLPLLVDMEFILKLWLKTVPEYSAVFARIVLGISLIGTWRNSIISLMHATGRIKLPNIICGSLLIATLPISYLFLKLGNTPIVVFVISLVITFVSMFVEWILISSYAKFSIREAMRRILFPSFVVLFVTGLVMILYYYHYTSTTLTHFAVMSGITLLLNIGVIFVLGLSKQERGSVLGFIKKKLLRK